MRLVRWKAEQQRHGPDQAPAVKGAEDDPLLPAGGGQRVAPERLGHFLRQRMHEADRAAIRYRFDQDLTEHRANFGRRTQGFDLNIRHEDEFPRGLLSMIDGVRAARARLISAIRSTSSICR
jgi:hypothetical protein